MKQINIKWLDHGKDLLPPAHATPGSSGLDLAAAINYPIILVPGVHQLIPTGFCIALPEGYEGQIRPRSGLALKYGITVLNAPGTIDADYRGEVKVNLINHSQQPFEVKRGMRIAQLIIHTYQPCILTPVNEDEFKMTTERDLTGFGSTGL